MLQWAPATETEAAMRDALAAADQDGYFRILARTELLLPVSAEALAGRAPMGWGTWTTGNRTHVLAFTSPAAMRLCLNEPYGSYRSVPFSTLAHEWPNHEWWLAINPGLPIEAYLPAWFIAQLVRGEVRLPGRTGARARMAQSDLTAAINGRLRAAERNRTATPPRAVPPPAPPPPAAPSEPASTPSNALAPLGTPTYGPPGGSVYGLSDGSTYGLPPRPVPGSPDYGPGGATVPSDVYGWSEGYQQPTYGQGSAYGGRVYGPAGGGPSDGYAWSAGHQTAPTAPTYGRVDRGPAVGPEPYRPESYRAEPYQTPPYPAESYRAESNHAESYQAESYQAEQYQAEPYSAGTYQAESYPAEPASPPTRVTATVGGPTVETVDAEIIEVGPEPAGRDDSTVAADPGPEATIRVTADLATGRRGPAGYATPGFGTDASGGYDASGSDPGGPTVRVEPPPAPAATQPSSWTPRRGMIEDAEIVEPSETTGFVPANETELKLLSAVESNDTDAFLSTLLLARVILPVPSSMPPGSRPRDKFFPWQIEEVDGERRIAVFTSNERLADYGQDRFGSDMSTMSVSFTELIEAWPSPRIQFVLNPGTPVGTTLPGSQIVALASWAAEVGLRRDTSGDVAPRKPETTASAGVAGAPTVGADNAVLMQRAVPPAQLSYYLERGYDRVSGFVNRASEVAHLKTPQALYRALGLIYPGSPFKEDDTEVHVLRWVAHRPDLYRLPYGGQNEAAMRAMQGWVIERPPFRGNGFAPGDTDVVAEFKVDSVRLPHGAQMWRLTREGTEELVATFDADKGRWVRTP